MEFRPQVRALLIDSHYVTTCSCLIFIAKSLEHIQVKFDFIVLFFAPDYWDNKLYWTPCREMSDYKHRQQTRLLKTKILHRHSLLKQHLTFHTPRYRHSYTHLYKALMQVIMIHYYNYDSRNLEC